MGNPVPAEGNQVDDEPDSKLNKIPQPRGCGGGVVEAAT